MGGVEWGGVGWGGVGWGGVGWGGCPNKEDWLGCLTKEGGENRYVPNRSTNFYKEAYSRQLLPVCICVYLSNAYPCAADGVRI